MQYSPKIPHMFLFKKSGQNAIKLSNDLLNLISHSKELGTVSDQKLTHKKVSM